MLRSTLLAASRDRDFDASHGELADGVLQAQLLATLLRYLLVLVVALLQIRVAPGHGDEQQLHQVLLNLVLNAIEAMETTEQRQLKVEVETSFVRLRNGRTNVSTETECIRVILTDTGVGIPESSMERLFTPFFTTKEEGCGLGLSVVHGIVAEHGGDIDVSSVPGRGTVFTLTLPGVAKPTAIEVT